MVLDLIIKKVFLDDILSGEKTTEVREIRPTNSKKYCVFDEEGNLIEAKKYNSIRFYNGYNKDRIAAEFEVVDIEIVLYDDEDTGEPLTYNYEGEEYQEADIIYTLGKRLS